jgi:hypothetical protein
MVKFQVGVYARLRPSRPKQQCHIRTMAEAGTEPPQLRSLEFSIQRRPEGDFASSKVEHHRFMYDRVFDGAASQVRCCESDGPGGG